MVDEVLWWIGCAFGVGVPIVFAVDLWLFRRYGGKGTVSQAIAGYTGHGREHVASAMLGFIAGAFLMHFTGWNMAGEYSPGRDDGFPWGTIVLVAVVVGMVLAIIRSRVSTSQGDDDANNRSGR